jgi:hypothetical protein
VADVSESPAGIAELYKSVKLDGLNEAAASRLRQWIADGSIQMLRGQLGVQADPRSGKVLFDAGLEDALGETPSAQLQQRYCHGLDFLIDAGGIPVAIFLCGDRIRVAS